ncbi:hypothetical protein [Photobacterium leiognathi]|uniref:hypothetical protein n=1 Tax=Photobacterium leiognathi TaxID=553611 RepID=UPI0029827E86|nr:hypothetical protein [Photobacterium leiognathi]
MKVLRTTVSAIILSSLALSGNANAVYYKDKADSSGLMNTSPTYTDKVIIPRQEYLTKENVAPTMPSLQYIAGTAQAERFVDKSTSDIDVKPYTQDRLVYQMYIPLDKMQGTPTNVVLTLKGNQKIARQLMMNFATTSWDDGNGKFNQQDSVYGYRFDGLDVYGALTDEKKPIDDIWHPYRDEHEFIDTSLSYQSRTFNFVKNDNGIPQEDVMTNTVDNALVRLRPMIHSFMPGGINGNGDNGNHASRHAPYFSVAANKREHLNAPILFTGRFTLQNKAKMRDHYPSELGFANKTPKYLKIVFYIRGGVRYWNPAATVSLKTPHNVVMNRNIAKECAIIDKSHPTVESYIPEHLRGQIPNQASKDKSFWSILSLSKKDSDKFTYWSKCESKRTEIYPLTYEVFVN